MDNVYIEALKIGREYPKGISYNKLVKQLGREDLSESTSANLYFAHWFYDHFTNPWDISKRGYNKNKIVNDFNFYIKTISNELSINESLSFMNGYGYELLLDYEKLEEARKSSKNANMIAKESLDETVKSNRQSKRAFIISIVALGLSIIFNVWSIYNSNQSDKELSDISYQIMELEKEDIEVSRNQLELLNTLINKQKNSKDTVLGSMQQVNKLLDNKHKTQSKK